MDIETILEIVTLCLGLCSVSLSIRWTVYFFRSKKGIGKAVSFMAFGEAFMAAMTCVFASLALLNALHLIPHIAQSIMRIFMFIIAMASTIHLAYQVKQIEDRV